MITPLEFTTKLSDDRIEQMLENNLNLSPNKMLNSFEMQTIRNYYTSFTNTLRQFPGKIFSNQLKPLLNSFEKANYDLKKLPKKYYDAYTKTYEQLKNACETDKSLKNKSAKLYCDIYELFNGDKMREFVKRLNTPEVAKKLGISTEDLNSAYFSAMESIEMHFTDICNGTKSFESFINEEFSTEFLGIDKMTAAITAVTQPIGDAATAVYSTTKPISNAATGITNALNFMKFIFLISFIIFGITLITLVMIFISYNESLLDLLSKQNELNEKIVNKSEMYTKSANEIENKLSPVTKLTVIKCSKMCVKYINRTIDTQINLFKNIKKFMTGRESFDNSMSMEAFVIGLTPLIVVASLAILIPVIRSAIYYFHHLGVELNIFLEEQIEILNVNIEDLYDIINDPKTPKKEKERLKKVIEKQKDWIKNLSVLSSKIYKKEIEAGNEAMDYMRKAENEKYEEEQVQQDNYESNDEPVNETSNNNTGAYIF